MNKIAQPDVMEIKNTWDSLNFGKYLIQKIYELMGETHEWEAIKKILDSLICIFLLKIIILMFMCSICQLRKEIIKII